MSQKNVAIVRRIAEGSTVGFDAVGRYFHPDVARGVTEAPIMRTDCTPLGAAPDDLTQHTGASSASRLSG
jgi:hypothetical protein